MSFAPLVPFGGNLGWSFLQRTREAQQETHSASPRMERTTAHFRDRIAGITTAQALVDDRRSLEVALGAFGLDADIDNRFFIAKILSSDLSDPSSLANRLSDKRYQALARDFGLGSPPGPEGPATSDPAFAARIIAAYRDRQFEAAVGEQNVDLRVALGLERDLGAIAGRAGLSDNAKWFTVMATPPVRKVLEGALGLPASFGALPLDRQLSEFRARAERILGASEIADLGTPEKIAEMTRRFLARSDLSVASAGMSRGSAALALLQSTTAFAAR